MNSITVRLAVIADSEHIFNWRNDEQTRSMSHTTDIVEWEGHSKWLEATLENHKRCLLMCCIIEGDERAAVVRFDVEADTALISINLAPSMRGKGLAKPCLISAIAFFRTKHSGVDCIEAEIKTANIASRNVFESVGFHLTQKTEGLGCYKLLT